MRLARPCPCLVRCKVWVMVIPALQAPTPTRISSGSPVCGFVRAQCAQCTMVHVIDSDRQTDTDRHTDWPDQRPRHSYRSPLPHMGKHYYTTTILPLLCIPEHFRVSFHPLALLQQNNTRFRHPLDTGPPCWSDPHTASHTRTRHHNLAGKPETVQHSLRLGGEIRGHK